MSVGDVIKLPQPAVLPDFPTPCWQDTVFFVCTTAGHTGGVFGDPPPLALFAAATTPGDTVTADGVDGLVWTAFKTNEPVWKNYQAIEEAIEWTAGLPVSYGTVVRVASRPDVHFLCITPSGPPVISGTGPFSVADIVFGEKATETSTDPSHTTITWQAWPTGAETTPAAWAASPPNYARGDKVMGSNGIRYICQTAGSHASGAGDPFVGQTFDPGTHGWYDPITGALITVTDGALEWIPYEPFVNMFLDNGVVWAVATANAVCGLASQLEIANCDVTTFPNAAIHLTGNLNTDLNGFGGIPSSIADEFSLRRINVVQCGAGVVTRGGEAQAGTGYEVNVAGASDLERTVYPAERGIVDHGFLGNRWYMPFVQAVGGPAFAGPESASSSGAVFGMYIEADCGASDVSSTAYTASSVAASARSCRCSDSPSRPAASLTDRSSSVSCPGRASRRTSSRAGRPTPPTRQHSSRSLIST